MSGKDMAKRALDLFLAMSGIVLFSPIFLFCAVWIKLDTRGPILHRGVRVGKDGRTFHIFKFRTMVANAASCGPCVTAGDDPRITRSGRFLRRTKLDELPQIINVLVGEMSIVGPRPEDPRYVALYTPEQRRILRVRPGITSLASIEYRNEEDLLSTEDLETVYRTQVMPRKLEIDLDYIERMSFTTDLSVIARTFTALFRT